MGNTHCYGAKRENKQRLSVSEDLQNHKRNIQFKPFSKTEQVNDSLRFKFEVIFYELMWYLALMYVSMQMIIIIILVKTLIEAFLDEASRNAAKQHICPRILHFFKNNRSPLHIASLSSNLLRSKSSRFVLVKKQGKHA